MHALLAGAQTRAWRRVEGERLTGGSRRQEGVRMRASANRAVGYGRVVSSLAAGINVIDYENKGLSQEHMLCVCSSVRRGDTVLCEL